jgi:alpha-galactosidase/6-phospho-beta-glucosidase family protein
MVQKIVLIGAGSTSFGLGILGDILKCDVLKGSTVVLHDLNAKRLKRVSDAAQQFVADQNLPFTVTATTVRREALQDATFCVSAIEVGDRFELWEQDWYLPLQYGLHQVYGENGGPGGIFHALRNISPLLAICADIQDLCPDAYFFNLSNPMIPLCMAIHRRYPTLKVIGLCHEICSLPRHLPRLLQTPLTNLSIKAGGLNHFSFLLEVSYKESGDDAYPDVRRKAPAYFAQLPSGMEAFERRIYGSVQRERHGSWIERGVFKELFERFGYLPITTDSHLGEYIQWAYEVADHKGIRDFFSTYRAAMTYKAEEEPEALVRKGTDPEEYWRVVPIMEGILSDSQHEELAVSLPNDHLIENLSTEFVVDVPAVVDRHGVHGIKLGNLPKGIAGLMNNQFAVNDLVVEAAIQQSRDLVLQALLVNPLVDSTKKAEQVLEEMLEVQKPYLGYLQ